MWVDLWCGTHKCTTPRAHVQHCPVQPARHRTRIRGIKKKQETGSHQEQEAGHKGHDDHAHTLSCHVIRLFARNLVRVTKLKRQDPFPHQNAPRPLPTLTMCVGACAVGSWPKLSMRRSLNTDPTSPAHRAPGGII